MNLFIQIKNGNPIDHPIMEENFIQVFPEIDVNNLPENFAKFERVQAPIIGPYEKNQRVQYEWVDGIVKDVWYADKMDENEKIAKQNFVKENWKLHGYQSWTFNETNCMFEPPIPYPSDGKPYVWDEVNLKWADFNHE